MPSSPPSHFPPRHPDADYDTVLSGRIPWTLDEYREAKDAAVAIERAAGGAIDTVTANFQRWIFARYAAEGPTTAASHWERLLNIDVWIMKHEQRLRDVGLVQPPTDPGADRQVVTALWITLLESPYTVAVAGIKHDNTLWHTWDPDKVIPATQAMLAGAPVYNGVMAPRGDPWTPDGPPLEVGQDVAVSLPDGGFVPFRPILAHRIHAESVGFANNEERAEHPIRHVIELAVSSAFVAEWGDARETSMGNGGSVADPTRADEAIQLLRAEGAPAIAEAPSYDPCVSYRRGLADGGTLVGLLVIDEFPERHVQDDVNDWFWYTDVQCIPQYTAMDTLVREVANTIHPLTNGRAMRNGSLWWLRSLHVHPRCRGHALGASLLAHALWTLVRGRADAVILEAFPEPSIFVPPGTDALGRTQYPGNPAAVDGLVRYFARMGFTRADHDYEPFMKRQIRPMELLPDLGISGPSAPGEAVPMSEFVRLLRFAGVGRLVVRQ